MWSHLEHSRVKQNEEKGSGRKRGTELLGSKIKKVGRRASEAIDKNGCRSDRQNKGNCAEKSLEFLLPFSLDPPPPSPSLLLFGPISHVI